MKWKARNKFGQEDVGEVMPTSSMQRMHKEDFVMYWDLCYDTGGNLTRRPLVGDKGAIMPLEISQKQLLQALTQQAINWFGEEQARDLHAQLEERTAYLWLLSQHLPDREQEPDFLCSFMHNGEEG